MMSIKLERINTYNDVIISIAEYKGDLHYSCLKEPNTTFKVL